MPLFVWAAIAIAVVLIGVSTIIVPTAIALIVTGPIGYAIAIAIVAVVVIFTLKSLNKNKEGKQ